MNEDGQMPKQPNQNKVVGYIRFHLQPENIEVGTDGKFYLPVTVEMESSDKVTVYDEKWDISEAINSYGK
jgi:hypothetical protein